MSNGIDAVKAFLNSLEFERTPYATKNQSLIQELTDTFAGGENRPRDFFKKKSLFGFVPVFRQDGRVDVYIRMGGPEIIRKAIGNIVNTSLKNHYGETQLNLPTIDNHGVSNYAPDLAVERDLIQRSLMLDDDLNFGWSGSQIAKIYPFRLHSVTDGFKLQYAKDPNHNFYSDIDANTLGAFVADIISSAITTSLYSNDSSSTAHVRASMLDLSRGDSASGNMKAILEFVFTKMAVDLQNAVEVNVQSYLDMLSPSANQYDHLYWHAFFQFSNRPKKNLGVSEYVQTLKIAEDVALMLNGIPDDVDGKSVAGAVNFYFNSFVSTANLQDVGQEKVQEANEATKKLTQQVAHLESKNKKLQTDVKGLVSPKTYRNVGMVAGLISSYMAVTQDSAKDMDLWKKALIIAGGTGLGAIPYVSFLTIATMPYLVDKGIELSGDEEFKARTRERLTRAKEASIAAGRNLAAAGLSARDRLRQRRLGQDDIIEAEVVDVGPLALPAPEES